MASLAMQNAVYDEQASREAARRAMTYERIRYRDDAGNRATVILRDPTIQTFGGSSVLKGIEVDRFGVKVAPKGVDERIHIISTELVIRRTPLRMNNHYAELETI